MAKEVVLDESYALVGIEREVTGCIIPVFLSVTQPVHEFEGAVIDIRGPHIVNGLQFVSDIGILEEVHVTIACLAVTRAGEARDGAVAFVGHRLGVHIRKRLKVNNYTLCVKTILPYKNLIPYL